MAGELIIVGNEEETREPWDRQPGESQVAYAAFSSFRDLGPTRTLTEVSAKLSKSRQLLSRWSRIHQWQERIVAFDVALHRQRQRDLLAVQRAATEQHAEDSKKLLEKVRAAIEAEGRGFDPTALETVAELLRSSAAALLRADYQVAGESIECARAILGGRSARPPSAKVLGQLGIALQKGTTIHRAALNLPISISEHDISLKTQAQRALELTSEARAIINQSLCADCYQRVADRLQRAAERERRMMQEL